MEGLGRVFDLAPIIAPVDLEAAASTGLRVSLERAQAVAFVLFKEAGVAGEDPILTLKEHNAASGGTSQNLAAIDKYYYKQATPTVAGTETWQKVTQAAAATLTLNATSAESQGIYVVEVDATQLSAGFTHVSLDIADTGAGASPQWGSVMAILHGLTVQRAPDKLVATL